MAARVLAVYNRKGGVSKTTSIVNLAARLAKKQQRVLLVDADPQCNATSASISGNDDRLISNTIYGVFDEPENIATAIQTTDHGYDIMIGDGDLAAIDVEIMKHYPQEEWYTVFRKTLEAVKDAYDVILIECPPEFGFIARSLLVAAGEVLVPMKAGKFETEGLFQVQHNISMVRNENPELRILGIVISLYQKSALEDDYRARIADFCVGAGLQLFNTVIPFSKRNEYALAKNTPIVLSYPHSNVAKAYRQLADEVLQVWADE